VSLYVRPAAAADFEEAHRWYEQQSSGLGEEFLAAVSEVFQALSENPKRYRVVHRDTRRALLRRFPYGIFYRVMEDDVVVVACFHGSRNPHRWETRQ
jgi:plasmid stabilization system protein ParE